MEFLLKSSRLIVTSRTFTRRVAVPIPSKVSGSNMNLGSTRNNHTLFMITIYLKKIIFRTPTLMGSFNSAPKINNSDSQDDSLVIPKGLSTPELLQHCKHLRGENQPPLLTRFFLKPLSTLSAQMVSSDLTDGLRCLKLDTVSRVCSAPLSDPNHIRLLQWNLLSQTLGQNNDGFVRCPEEALTWENRKFLIVQEILQNNPDIICLQEVDHYKFLQNILGTQNYEGIFFPKPDSPCLYIEENNGPDGCAIFYKRDKFELKNFDTRILEVWRVQSNQVAIAANLKIKATGREICVCTTHLKARHGSLLSKLRNEQGRDLIRFVKQFAGDRAVMLCGDFNAEPIEPVYSTILNCEFLKLSSAYSDIRAESDECNNENITKDKLDNCDKVQKSIQNEPPYTTWKIREDGEVCHTIDYVFYTKDNLKVKNCLEFPQGDEIGKNRTPSFQYPSDHFSLICDFEVLDQQPNDASEEKIKKGMKESKCRFTLIPQIVILVFSYIPIHIHIYYIIVTLKQTFINNFYRGNNKIKTLTLTSITMLESTVVNETQFFNLHYVTRFL
ncbi:Nocturnin [Lucilia cuprina]|nr:Nocturnin [Lucilia cuprina]